MSITLAKSLKLFKEYADTYNPRSILIRVPLYERDWKVPFKEELGVDWRLDPTHETEYTIATFTDEIKDTGLCISSLEVHWGEIWAEITSSVS